MKGLRTDQITERGSEVHFRVNNFFEGEQAPRINPELRLEDLEAVRIDMDPSAKVIPARHAFALSQISHANIIREW